MPYKVIEAFRLFRSKDDLPEVLFHSFDRKGKKTKQVPFDIWLKAEERQAWNPGKKEGPGFLSGWHIVKSKEEAEEYITRFTNKEDLRICRVLVKGMREKPRSKVMLAKWMRVSEKDWKKYGTAR